MYTWAAHETASHEALSVFLKLHFAAHYEITIIRQGLRGLHCLITMQVGLHHSIGLFDCSFFTLMAAFLTYDTMVSSLGLAGPDHFMCDLIFYSSVITSSGQW